MFRPDPVKSGSETDAVVGFVDSVARFVFYGGIICLAISLGMLIFTAASGAERDVATTEQAFRNIELFSQVAMIAGILGGLGACWLFWGEETLGAGLLFIGGGFYFSPAWLPVVLATNPNDTGIKAMDAIKDSNVPIAVIGLIVIGTDLFTRVRLRVREGSRADQLKYGKGLKEEKDVKNVFLGKCWQLPYCRKFVRERCPIYHSRRTCWQERVGCMCEEAVIQNAMEGKVIPSDVVAAAKFIPRNSKYTPQQKAERCRQCVIYNEHQKHKYQVCLPAMVASLVGLYFAVKIPMTGAIEHLLVNTEKMAAQATLNPQTNSQELAKAATGGVIPYSDIVLVALFLILFAYCIRILEYLIFKLKV